MSTAERAIEYRPTSEWVSRFEDDPWTLLDALEDWELCVKCDVENYVDDVQYEPEGVRSEFTDLLVLWIDMHHPNIDPRPLRDLTGFLTTIRHPLRRILDRSRRAGFRVERDVPPSQEVVWSVAMECKFILDRIRTVARVRLSRTPACSANPALMELGPTAREAWNYIVANQGAQGAEIAQGIHKSYEHFRKGIVPALKACGVTNRGDGYFPPKGAMLIPALKPHTNPT